MKPPRWDLQARWDRFWHAELPEIRLAAFRHAILLSLLAYLLHRWRHAGEWLTTAGFHPSLAVDAVHGPQVPLIPAAWLPLFGALLFGGLALAVLGWLRRPATWLTLALLSYANLADPVAAFTLNRVYCFALLVLALAPAPRDSAIGPTIPAWPVRLLQLGLLVHYFSSGLCKSLYGAWLGDADVLWRQMQGIFMTDSAAWLVRSLPRWAFTAQQHLALGFELLAPLLLGVRRLRPLGLVLGVGMHVFIAVNMHLLVYFSLQMLCFYVLFVAPERLERLWPRWLR